MNRGSHKIVAITTEKQPQALEYDLTVGLSAIEGRGFYHPTDTAIAPNGMLYVPNRSVDEAPRGIRVTVRGIYAHALPGWQKQAADAFAQATQ